jgi:hypothetical protein
MCAFKAQAAASVTVDQVAAYFRCTRPERVRGRCSTR